jgi:hypothetical protein
MKHLLSSLCGFQSSVAKAPLALLMVAASLPSNIAMAEYPAEDSGFQYLRLLSIFSLLLLLYVLPTLISFGRGHPSRFAILVLNLTLGFTGLGWIACLVWSLLNIPSKANTGITNQTAIPLMLIMPGPGKTASSTPDLGSAHSRNSVAMLAGLAQLLEQGHLSEQEFNEHKRKLLLEGQQKGL